MNTYKVYFNHGLMNQLTIQAPNSIVARQQALAEYRKNCALVDTFDLDFVVGPAVLITENN